MLNFYKKKTNLKLIAIERTPLKELEIYFGFIDKIKKLIMKSLISYFYKKFDLVICNSRYLGKYLKKKYNIDSKPLFPPSIKKQKIFKKTKIPKYKKSIIKIITVCRLSREKIFMKLFKQSVRLKKIIFFIVGDGPEKKNLLKYIKSLNLEKKVKLIGFEKDPFKYLAKADLYINSSYFEGFPEFSCRGSSYRFTDYCFTKSWWY